MQDFGSFCFLDPQKTGSVFVTHFLERNINIPLVRFEQHGNYQWREGDEGKFFFITARDPAAWYKSLYLYGVAGKGGLFAGLRKQGLGDFYDGSVAQFAAWVAFMLDPAKARFLGESYAKAADLLGFESFRFLAQALPDPLTYLREAQNRADIIRIWDQCRLPRRVLRTERLTEEMIALVDAELKPYIIDREAALKALRTTGKLNVSAEADHLVLPPDLLARIEAREWFMFDVLGFDRYG